MQLRLWKMESPLWRRRAEPKAPLASSDTGAVQGAGNELQLRLSDGVSGSDIKATGLGPTSQRKVEGKYILERWNYFGQLNEKKKKCSGPTELLTDWFPHGNTHLLWQAFDKNSFFFF